MGLTGSNGIIYPLVRRQIEVLSIDATADSCASTGIDEVLASYDIPAGLMGVNSVLQIEPMWSFTSSANNKILKVKVAGQVVYTATRTTFTREAPLIVLANRNSLSAQIKPYDSAHFTAGTGSPGTYTIDFEHNVTVEITGQRANSGDTLSLEYHRILHFIGN
jgi:hypothetical protein